MQCRSNYVVWISGSHPVARRTSDVLRHRSRAVAVSSQFLTKREMDTFFFQFHVSHNLLFKFYSYISFIYTVIRGATSWTAGIRFSAGSVFLFFIASRPALGPTQPPIQCVLGAVSPGVTQPQPQREADRSPPATTDIAEMRRPRRNMTSCFLLLARTKARVQRPGEVCRSLAQTRFAPLSEPPEPGTLPIVPLHCFGSFPSLPYLPLFLPVFINFAIPPPRACYVPQRRTQVYTLSTRECTVWQHSTQRRRTTDRHLRKEDKLGGSCNTHRGVEKCMHISVGKHEGCCQT
jgi:hypothetical protein